METFFMQNSEIQEWVDLLIEKTFTVCLLGNSNADSELYIGRQTIEKIAGTLQKVANLSNDTLKEGVKQLIEQRLPDPRVMENFPQFYDLMEELISSGISLAPQNEVPPIKVNTDNTGLLNSRIALKKNSEHGDSSFPISIPESNLKDEDNNLVTVFAPIPSTYQNQADTSYESNGSIAESEAPISSIEPLNDSIKPSLKVMESANPEAACQLQSPDIQIQAGEERLLMLLKQIYPETQPHLNVVIGGYPIFAQVSELLIYFQSNIESSSDDGDIIEADLKKLGYRVVILQKQDLAYPRRMERLIRQALRKETKSRPSTWFLG